MQRVRVVPIVTGIAWIRSGGQAGVTGDELRVDLQKIGAQRLPLRSRHNIVRVRHPINDVACSIPSDGSRLENCPDFKRGVIHVVAGQPRAEVAVLENGGRGDIAVADARIKPPRHFPIVEEEQLLVVFGGYPGKGEPAADVAAELVVA